MPSTLGGGGNPSTMVDIKKSAIGGLILGDFKGADFFVAEFSHITQLVPYFLQEFRTFLKWYHFCFIFSHFSQISSTVFKATFCICTFGVKKSKGAKFLGI